MTFLGREANNENIFDRLAAIEDRLADAEARLSTRVFTPLIGNEGDLGNRAATLSSIAIGLPGGPVTKFHLYGTGDDENFAVGKFENLDSILGGHIFLHGKNTNPADGQVAGNIRAVASNDGTGEPIYSEIYFVALDVSAGNERGGFQLVNQENGNDEFVLNVMGSHVGIQTDDPQRELHVVGDDGPVDTFPSSLAARNVAVLENNNNCFLALVGDVDSLSGLRVYEDGQTGVQGQIRYDHSTDTWIIATAASGTARITVQTGLQVGAPTGGDKGGGTINVSSEIYKNNTAYTNPDYALEFWVTGEIKQNAAKPGAANYRRHSLAEVEAAIRQNFRLPGFPNSPMGIFSRSDLALEKIEEIFTHLIEQNKEIADLKARLAALEQ